MYNNPYITNYTPNINQQNLNDNIDNQINQLQRMKDQLKNNSVHQPAINQTFQLAPQSSGLKMVSSVEDVKKELTISDTPFVNNDYTMLWIKNAKGDIKSFELNEIVQKDDKDLKIEELTNEIERLKKEITNNEQQYSQSDDETYHEYKGKQFDKSVETKSTSNVSNTRKSTRR